LSEAAEPFGSAASPDEDNHWQSRQDRASARIAVLTMGCHIQADRRSSIADSVADKFLADAANVPRARMPAWLPRSSS